MKVHDLFDEPGQLRGFEISSTIGRAGVRRLLARLAGVSNLRARRLFDRHWRDIDSFCLFDYRGTAYHVTEPFGDNSRYLIAPTSADVSPSVALLRDEFAGAVVVLGLVIKREKVPAV